MFYCIAIFQLGGRSFDKLFATSGSKKYSAFPGRGVGRVSPPQKIILLFNYRAGKRLELTVERAPAEEAVV